jgi:nucleotide-binding universal stress UspA family protein
VASRSSGDEAAQRIVVGIGDSGPGHYHAALTLAAQMSRQRQAELSLVHGCHSRFSLASGDGAAQHDVAHGRELLEEAEHALAPLVDDSTRISLAAVPLTAVDALLNESQTAGTLIVQRRDLSTLRRALSADTSHTVAARATCPVIVVRQDQSDIDLKRGIVVGVAPRSGLRALEVGLAEAAARNCPLTAVCVWDLQFSPTYGGWIDPDDLELTEASAWADSLLTHAVAGVAKGYPGVQLHARSVKGVVENGLLAECEDAELLIIERHRDAHIASIGLGSLTRHLIDHAPCPVMVTPQSDTHDQLPAGHVIEPNTTAQS